MISGLVNSFVSDRQLRGLSPRICQLYEGYLTRFANSIDRSLLDVSKIDIATVLASLDCNAVGKHTYFRVLVVGIFAVLSFKPCTPFLRCRISCHLHLNTSDGVSHCPGPCDSVGSCSS